MISFNKAKLLSIKKWQMHIDAGGYNTDLSKDPELKNLDSNCGFCERYVRIDCSLCEFGKIAGICIFDENSLYNKWYIHKTQQNAQVILDVIINLKENIHENY